MPLRHPRDPVVLVTVGTSQDDSNPLVRWFDHWPARCMANVVVVHGTIEPLNHILKSADAIVSQGCPSTVERALRAGIRPIVVPHRAAASGGPDPDDDGFLHNLTRLGLATIVQRAATLYTELDRLFLEPDLHRITARRRDYAGFLFPTTHMLKNCEPPPYA